MKFHLSQALPEIHFAAECIANLFPKAIPFATQLTSGSFIVIDIARIFFCIELLDGRRNNFNFIYGI